MWRGNLAFLVVVAVVFGLPMPSRAQVILSGCTGNTSMTGPPSSIVDIDLATGLASNPRNTGILLIGGIATQPGTGNVFGLTTFASSPASTLVRIDMATGICNAIGPTGLANIVEGDLAFNPLNGLLYGIQDFGPTFNQRNLFRINPATGAATVVGSLGSTGDYSALAFGPSGTLYAIETTGINSTLFVIDPNTAAIVSSLAMNADLAGGAGMTFHPLTGVAYVADGGVANTNLLYTLDASTGNLTAVGPINVPGGIAGLTFVNVPEPTSICLAILTIVANRCCRRRSTQCAGSEEKGSVSC